LLPTLIEPKDRLVGESVSGAFVTPVPAIPICNEEFEAVLVTVAQPDTHEERVGPNVMLNVALWPAAREAGRASPDVLNGAFEVTAEIVMLVFPVLVSVTLWVSDWLNSTDPKLSLVLELCSC